MRYMWIVSLSVSTHIFAEKHAFGSSVFTNNAYRNKPSIWEFLNLSVDAHVIHLHQVRFKILDRRDVGLSYHTFSHPTGRYRQYPKDAV